MIYIHKNKNKTHEIEVYDSIQKLPILRFQKFNKYQMIASEIGNDFSDFDRRMEKGLAFLHKNMIAEALQEFKNMRMTVWNAFEEFTPMGKSFAVLIRRIDNVVYEEFAPDDLDKILAHLSNIGFDIDSSVAALVAAKKKIELELSVYFPSSFHKDGDSETATLRYSRVNLQLDKIIEEKDIDQEVYNIEKEILQRDKPNVWNVHSENNMERAVEVDFMKYAIQVTEMSGGQELETMSTFKFYATTEMLKDKHTKK